jgi:hypothetical protein
MFSNPLKPLGAFALAALMAALSLCAAAEPTPPPPPPPPVPSAGPAVPKELAAAAERWKLERAAERAAQPGVAGQHDLFWEVVKLWEADAKARADADLAAVVDWLLFTVGLWNDQNLADPVYGKVPTLVPALGDKLMDKRLAVWVASLQTSSGGGEPWTWADFPGLDKKALAAAVGRQMKSGPRSNPVARAWLAVLLASAGDEKGLEELSAARAALEKDLPSRAGQINAAMATSLSNAGIKACLPLLLDLAEAELAGAKAPPPADRFGRPMPGDFGGGYGPGTVPWSLTRFHQLVGWPTAKLSAAGADLKAAVAKARTWLKDSYPRLAWDAKLRRFTGGVVQPGMERLGAAAAAVEKKWNLSVLDRLGSGQQTYYGALQELVGVMENQAEAAKDPAAIELFSILLEEAGPSLPSYGSSDSLRTRLARLSPELAGRYMACGIKTSLLSRGGSNLDYYLQSLSAGDAKAVKEAMAILAPEMEKLYAEAAKGTDAERTLNLALACLFTGAKLDKKELAALVAKAPASSGGYSGDSTLAQRAQSMARCGRTGGLRLLLAVGRKEIGRYSTDGANHPIRQFGQLAGWRAFGESTAGTAEEELARAEAWLDKYDSRLVWDRNRGQFTGALPPGMETAIAAAEAAKERWGLKVDEALAGGSQDAARRLFSEIIELMEKKPEAAADGQLAALALALVEPGRIDDNYDDLLRERLYVKLPKLNREAGVKAWTNMLRKRLLGEGTPRRDPGDLAYLGTRLKGYDPTVAAEAAKALLPELKKSWDAAPADKFEDRVGRAMAYVFAGGDLPKEDLDKLLAEADKLGSSGYSRLAQWSQPIAQAGNPAGLKLMLTSARNNRATRANTLGQFDYLTSRKAERFGGDYYNLTDEQQIERVDACLKWLEENQKNLEFVPGQNRFKLKVEAPGPKDPKKGPGPGPEVF